MSSKVRSIGFSKHEKLLSIMSRSDPQINLNKLGSVKKMTEMRSKVWNIDTKFVVFTNKYEDKSENLCLFKFGVLSYRKLQKLSRIMFISNPQIILNRLGCMEK